MSRILLLLIVFVSGITQLQAQQTVTAADCQDAVNVCTNLGFTITPNGTGQVMDIPTASATSICNPSTAPTGTGAGCLLGGEINSTWMVVNIASGGNLEFVFGGNGTQAGFYDWAMWPYNPNTTCNDLFNCTLAPVACNWNAATTGGTGMSGLLPAGGNPGNYVPPLAVNPGDQYIICFTNYSSAQNVNVPLDFTGTAQVSCFPVSASVCLGDSTPLIASASPGSMYSWAPPNGLSSTTDSMVMASPLTTTDYTVTITELNGFVFDTTITVFVYMPPMPDAGPNDVTCDLNYTFNAILSDTFPGQWSVLQTPSAWSTVTWAPNDTDPNATATVNIPGTYTFIYTESNGWCPPVDDTITVLFASVPHTTTTTIPSCVGICDGQVDIVGNPTYQYSLDALTWQTDSFYTGLCAGSYWLYIQDANSCIDSSQFNIIDPSAVVLTVSQDTTVCIDGTATISATAVGGTGPYTMTWNNGLVGNGPHAVQPTVAICHTVFATDASGCTSPMDSICLSLNPSLNVTNSGDVSICSGDVVNIFGNGTGGIGAPYTYNWLDGNTSVGTGDDINVSPTTNTTYCIVVTDGCETPADTACLLVSMEPMPSIDFFVDIDSACIPSTSTFTMAADPNLVATAEWDFGNGTTALNPTVADVTYSTPGCYDVSLRLTTPAGCVVDTMVPQMVCVYGFPVAAFTPNPQPTTTSNTNITFYNQSIDNVFNLWAFDSLGTSTDEQPDFLFPNLGAGVYPVTLWTTNEYGCVDSITIDVTIQEDFLIYVPNSFTPNGDGINDDFCVLGNDLDQSAFTFQIYDRWGLLVYETSDINGCWDGMYMNDPAPIDVYVWRIEARGGFDQIDREFMGHVNLIR